MKTAASNPHAAPGSKAAATELAPASPAAAKASARAARLPDETTLERLVHEGHAGEVWRGLDATGRQVAVKIATSGDAPAAARFEAEALALALLTHRSIVRLRSHGETTERRPFIALEWLEGPTLAALLTERDAGLPPRDAVRLLMPIANALSLAHDRGLVHGDVRAEHVLLVPLGEGRVLPKLIDFSASQPLTAWQSEPDPSEPTPLVPAGSPAAVDVRGLAATIVHAIAGERPFSSTGSGAAGETLQIPRTGLSQRDAALWRILAEGLAPPSIMPRGTLQDFIRSLASWADSRGVEADITGRPISRSSSPPSSRSSSLLPSAPALGTTPRGPAKRGQPQ